MTTNALSLHSDSLKIRHGSVSLQESLNDYPRITLVEFQEPGTSRALGELLTHGGLVFSLDNISIEKCPIPVDNLQDKITYSYIHVSQKLLEFPIQVKDFTESASPSKKTKESNYYSIGSLVAFAKSRGRFGNVIPPAFLVELGKNPSPGETITLKDVIDPQLEVLNLVYDFTGDAASFIGLASKGKVLPNIVRNYTLGQGLYSAYFNSALTWKQKNNNEPDKGEKRKRFQQLKDKPYVLYEGDFNPHLPPPETADNSKYPRDLSIMFDNSGVTKTCKMTRYEWNKPSVELEATFGFAHAAIELVNDPNKPNTQSDRVIALMSEDVATSGNAYQEVLSSIKSGKFGYPDDADFSAGIIWRLISVKQKEYVYESLGITVSPKIKKPDGSYQSAQIAAGYEQFTNSSAQVLVREVSQGWELKRFAQEDAQNWTDGSIQSWLQLKALIEIGPTLTSSSVLAKQQYYWMLYYAKINLEKYLYRKIPLWEQVDYSIAAYSEFYKDAEKIDWQVNFLPKSAIIGNSSTEDEDEELIPVITPDVNWEPALMLLGQSRLKMSIGLSGNPDYDPYKRNYFATNPVSITTGSEEYELTVHSVLPSKNRKTSIGNLTPAQSAATGNHTSVKDVINNIGGQLSIPGTVYQTKDFTAIPDYGITGYPLPAVNPGKISGNTPLSLDDAEDRFSTTVSVRSAQDHSYKNHLTTTSFTISEGRPPGAVTRKPMFQEIEDNSADKSPYTNTVMLITSSNYSPYAPVSGSVNISAAESLGQALNGARFKLTMESVNASTTSMSLHFSSTLEPLLYLNKQVLLPNTNESWVVKGCTQSIHYTDGTAFMQPIELEAGLLLYPAINSRAVKIKPDKQDGQDSMEAEVTAQLPRRYGTPIEQIPANFGRWLDTN